MATKQEKLERIKSLMEIYEEKSKFHYGKWNRARTAKSLDLHVEKWRNCDRICNRIRSLFINIRDERKLFTTDTWDAEFDYRIKQRSKAEGKEKFETLHKYSPWFYSDSLGADYGSFTCSKCGSTFYHSPSAITKASKTVYECCCGHCTNSIIERDWNETPFG